MSESDSGGSIDQSEIEALLQNSSSPKANPDPPNTPAEHGAAAPSAPQAPQAEPTAAVEAASDDIDLLLRQAEEAIASTENPAPQIAGLSSYQLQNFTGSPASDERATLELLGDVELDLKIELGRTEMMLEDVLKLRKGAVVPLDKLAGDPVDIFVNGRLIARGEVLVLNDNFCVRVAELISGDLTQNTQ